MSGFTVLSFGKFKGCLVEEVPSSYLVWLLDEATNLRYSLRCAVEEELARRTGYTSHKSTLQLPALPNYVSTDALQEVVAEGRRALARRYHPDMGGDLQKMQAVNGAADWLSELLSEVRR